MLYTFYSACIYNALFLIAGHLRTFIVIDVNFLADTVSVNVGGERKVTTEVGGRGCITRPVHVEHVEVPSLLSDKNL